MSALKTFRVRFQEITCYALTVAAPSEREAIGEASRAFYSLSRKQRAAAVICASDLDYFEAEQEDAS